MTTYKSTQVSDAERRAWQRKGAAALTKLLGTATTRKLPTLIWTVGLTGELIGTVPHVLHEDVDELRAQLTREWTAWVEALAAEPRQIAGGYDRDYLHAQAFVERSVLVVLKCVLPDRATALDARSSTP